MFVLKICLLLEPLGSWYSQPTEFTVSAVSANASSDEPIYCSCHGSEEGTMMCDNLDCQIEWFHLKCLHLSVVCRGK